MPKSSTNVRNRVNKLYLLKTKPLYPLFEAISNAMHAINKAIESEFKSEILSEKFVQSGGDFNIFISKSYSNQSHKILYCANERAVKDDGISKYLSDL